MKYLLLTSLTITSILTFSASSYAENSNAIKKWGVGVGIAALVLDSEKNRDFKFSGGALTATYFVSDNVAIKSQYYALNHSTYRGVKISGGGLSGIDISAYYGTGLTTKGFKMYLGGGLYNETIKFSGKDASFNGVQIVGGIGYNWDTISLDMTLSARSTGDYEDTLTALGEISTSSSDLILTYRF